MQNANRVERAIALATRGDDLPSPAECQRIRQLAGATQAELADAIGVHWTTISRWENGELMPTGDRRAAYRAFLTLARERRSKMTIKEALQVPDEIMGAGLSETPLAERVAGWLGRLGRGPVEVTVAEEGVRRMGDADESAKRCLLQFLVVRGLAQFKTEEKRAPADVVQIGTAAYASRQARVVKITEHYTITDAGREALAEVEAVAA